MALIMINLLPNDEKREILAGRTNRLLVRYNILLVIVMIMTLAAFGFVWLYLENIRTSSQEKIEQNEISSRQLLNKQQSINTFRANLNTAKTILDKQINYSTILLKVASTIPSGVVLDELTLDPSTIGKPTVLNARARSEAALLKLKESFSESSFYSDAHFDTITRTASDNDKYPYHVTMTVTFTQELLK